MSVYPKLPVPKAGGPRDSEAKLGPKKAKIDKFAVGIVAGMLIGGILIGWLLRPRLWTDPRIGESEEAAAAASKKAAEEKERGDKLDKDLEALRGTKKAQDKELEVAKKAESELASRNSAADRVHSDTAAAQKKVQGAVGKLGGVVADGNEVHVRLSDALLFKPNDDALTDTGKRTLDRVAVALKELPDRLVEVQGHTDDQPPVVVPAAKAPAPPAPPPKKGTRPAAATPAPAPPPPKFATNWELSALRALAVVRYLQDAAKIDPKRLVVHAFGQYRPISTKQADNRRVELVLVPAPEPKK
ncbi:MAG: OmpA family protein [Deltaproteobacteria bacterium]|nr:OmpA family protein [Deltaproteobacteria bacterium]MCW5804084.1 OmpA family protein [Deltaproteobacteria bacterium]